MTTIKVKFRPSSLPEARGTLYFQVIHRRQVKWASTGLHIYPHEWDSEKSQIQVHAGNPRKELLLRIRALLHSELRERERIMRNMAAARSHFTLDELFRQFTPIRLDQSTTVFAFLQSQVRKKLEMQRQGTAMTYTQSYRRFKEFRQDADLTFDQLTPDLIERYEAWLIGRQLKLNSIRFYLRTLKAQLRKAAMEDISIDRKLFSRVRLSYVPTVKRAISESQLKAIARLALPEGSPLAFARDIFLFSFFMRGMPFVDMAYLRKTDLRNGTLSYCRRKTRQHLTVAWEQAPQQIVDRYAHLAPDSPYMLPIIRTDDATHYRQYHRQQQNVNNSLRKIGRMIGLPRPLTTYVARHTWASVARDLNVPVAIISEGMGHRSYHTTQVYLNSIDTSRIDKANRMIIRQIAGT